MSRSRVAVGLALTLSSFAGAASADVPPAQTKSGAVSAAEQCPAARRAGLDCILATRTFSHLDEGTKKQLADLGFKKVCEESHNDRYMAHLCRRPDAARPVPEELERSIRGGALDEHGARMEAQLHEGRCRAWLSANPGADPGTSPACERVSVIGVRDVDGGPCTGFAPCSASVVPPPAYLAAWDGGADGGASDGGRSDDGGLRAEPLSSGGGCGRCSAAPSGAPSSDGCVAAGLGGALSLLAVLRWRAGRSTGRRRTERGRLSDGWRRRRWRAPPSC